MTLTTLLLTVLLFCVTVNSVPQEAEQLSSDSEVTAKGWMFVKGPHMKWVSTGPAGVWAVDMKDNIYYRKGTYNKGSLTSKGSQWTRVGGKLKQISVGWNIIWGVNSRDRIFYRTGVSPSNPKGTGWQSVGGRLKKVGVSPVSNAVWGVNSRDQIFTKLGITGTNRQGTAWQKIRGALSDVSVDAAGVWGVNNRGLIYYRLGTFTNQQDPGTHWKRVPGRLVNIDSGRGIIWGVNSAQNVFWSRIGTCRLQSPMPWRLNWQHVSGIKLKQISVNSNDNSVWAIDGSDRVVFRRGV